MVTKVTIWDKVTDTLAAAGLAPKRELEAYPNPVRRGTAVNLRWQQTDAGVYEVALFSSTGQRVQQRRIEVSAKEQLDLFALPDTLPTGIYFLRAARSGGQKAITLRIFVI
jgi:hypothetical protein